MNKMRIVQAVVLVAITVALSSCGPGRQYHRGYPPPPPVRTSVSLVLHAGPGIVVSRYHDGRYYYRHPSGMMYWRGPGNRYYLDRRHMPRQYKTHRQYRTWQRGYGRR